MLLVGVLAASGAGCAGDATPTDTADVLGPRSDALRQIAVDRGLRPVDDAPYPAGPLAEVGRMLFFDPILGGELDTACATCHHPEFGFADGTDLPIGVAGSGLGPDRIYPPGADVRPLGDLRPLGRNTPTALNLRIFANDAAERGLEATFNWEGRVNALGQFAHTPLRDRDEMRGDAYPALETQRVLTDRINAIEAYRTLFAEAAPETAAEGVSWLYVERALTQFMLTLAPGPTEFDRFLMGDTAADDAFLDGLALFLELDCVSCHNGAALSDHDFHRTGAPPNVLSRPFQVGIDIGRQEATGADADRYRFRTAPLRELAHTAPYMHAGTLDTLDDVVRFYTSGENPLAEHDPAVGLADLERGAPRALSDDEVTALVRFLGSMSSDQDTIVSLAPVPASVPSGLAPAAIEASE